MVQSHFKQLKEALCKYGFNSFLKKDICQMI